MGFVADPQPDPQSPAPAAPAMTGHFQPDLDHVITEQTRKAEEHQQIGSHTLFAFPRDPRTPHSIDIPQAGRLLKSGARGFVSSVAAMTGDTPEQIAARNKRIGLEQENRSGGDVAAEIVGGLVAPSPGKLPGTGTTLSAARAADKAAGTTLGQQTGSRIIQTLEKTLSRLPGGGAIVRAIQNQNEKLAQTTDDVVHQLSGGADTSAEGAGKVLEGQLGEAAQRMKNEAAGHYDEVEKLIPKSTQVGVKNTLETARKLTTPLEGAENVSARLIDPEIRAIREGLEKDIAANPLQALPYGTLKELRTRIGQMIDWGPFATDTKNGQLKQIYNSLTADMNVGASSVSKEAAEAVKKASSAYAKSKDEQAVLQSVINKAGGPEKVFTSLMSGTRDGATTLRQVLSSIDEPSRQILAASALQRMGKAVASSQNAAGTAFSAETFLTNWARMSPDARQVLFGSLPGNYAQNVSQLAANMQALRAYGKLIPNASNTAQALILSGEAGYALHSLLTGDLKTAGAFAGSAAGTMALAHALTNPQTVRWLANRTSQMLMSFAKGSAATQSGSPADIDPLGRAGGQ